MYWIATFISFCVISTFILYLWEDDISSSLKYEVGVNRFFKSLSYIIIIALVAFLSFTFLFTLIADIEYVPGEVTPINRLTMYDGVNNDVFYVWKGSEGGNNNYYVSVKQGNINKKKSVNIEWIKVVGSYDPAQFIDYEPQYKNYWLNERFPLWRKGFSEVHVPDKYVKLNAGL